MQMLIEDKCLQYMSTIELSILDLSDAKYMEGIRMKIIDTLKEDSNKETIKTLHEEFSNKISLEIKLTNYYDKLLQRSPTYIKLWHYKLNKYIEECNDYSAICDTEKLQCCVLKVSTLEEFLTLIEKMPVNALKVILRFCTHIVSDF